MSEFKAVGGKIVEMIESEVAVEDQVETVLQAELDQAQNDLNVEVNNLATAEAQYADAEAAAEAAGDLLAGAKTNKEAAEAKLTKSVNRRDSWVEAVRVRQEQLDQQAANGDGTDDDRVAEDGSVHLTGEDITVVEG